MVPCGKCGAQNALGCVFCVACGAKLDLAMMGANAVQEVQKKSVMSVVAPKIVGLVIVLVLASVVLSLWPQSRRLGERGTRYGTRRVENRIRTIERMPAGVKLGPEPGLLEKDINGFIEFGMAKKLRGATMSVAVEPGTLKVRVVRTLGKIDVWKVQFSPTLSLDLVCASSGERLAVKRAMVGHLPLLGPFAYPVKRSILNIARRQKEWEYARYVKQIVLDEGKVSLVVQK